MIARLFALIALILSVPVFATSAQHPHEAWTRTATIYEVNIRQYTPEGTISAFEKHLPRLKKMGVKILWIMPVQPIGEKNRKGSMGSYYAIRDYTAVNPEFGTQADFNRMVKTAHKLGMKVILDWVANHTAWDSKWATAHPEWFKRNAKGELTSYEYDNGTEIEYWTDVIGLDYRNPAVWDAQIDAMSYWVREAGIDGFRCDVASLMPTAFWIKARAELEKQKPMFMLAESNDPAIHAAFDITYDWKLLDTFAAIADGKAGADALRSWVRTGQDGFPADAYRMTFTTNHDVNSWRWGDTEKYGPRFRAFAVLAATLPGMPLIYSGQEAGLDRKIAFFEKDAIDWKRYDNADFYAALMKRKARHPALANGIKGGPVTVIDTGNPDVFAFRRALGKRFVTVAVNVSDKPVALSALQDIKAQTLPAWGYALGEK
jgi:glycosidase